MTNFGIKMYFENFFSVKTSVTLFQTCFKTLKTVGNSAKKATKARVIDLRIVGIQLQVPKKCYKKLKLDACNFTPT